MKKVFALLVMIAAFAACKKDKNADASPKVIEHNMQVSSIVGATDPDVNRKAFINLYDGLTYTTTEANASSSLIDFAYNYHGGGCNSCRFFENVKQMSTRTYYVENFSTITDSKIINAEKYYSVAQSDFISIKTSADIDSVFSKKGITNLERMADITDRSSDVAVGKVFAFIDKNGKRGFFTISDYTANVPTGDPATLTMSIKIQP